MITLQKFSIMTCIFIEMWLSDYNQQQQLLISRDNSMFPTMNGLLLSHFGDCDKAACTQFSVCIFFTVEARECDQILLPLYSFFFHLQDEFSSSLWKSSHYLIFGSCDHTAEIQYPDFYFHWNMTEWLQSTTAAIYN